MDPTLSNSSRGTLTSYTDHSMQRRLKSNAPNIFKRNTVLLIKLNNKKAVKMFHVFLNYFIMKKICMLIYLLNSRGIQMQV